MKLAVDLGIVQRSEEFPQQTFRIKASAKAFEILSSTLYSNPVKAIIRELSTNAADSHVAAGTKDIPFLVHLPNMLEPTFSIRDYGTGLSHEEMLTLYTTYFDSTRTDSNDYTGALGLGSKSPYSYTDNFIVTSFFNGEQRSYSMFKNEEGLPSVSLLSTSQTEEKNGLLIELAVEGKDFKSFLDTAESVYRYFSPRPSITGGKISYDDEEILYQGTGWKVLNKEGGYNAVTAVAIMGNIGYPLPQHLDPLFAFPFLIDFDIGALDIAASREALHLSDRTKEACRVRVSSIKEELSKEIEKTIDSQESLWEASIFLREAQSNYYSCSARLLSSLSLNLRWKGTRIPSGIFYSSGMEKLYTRNLRVYSSNSTHFPSERNCLFVNPDVEDYESKARSWVRAMNDMTAIILPGNKEHREAFLREHGIPAKYVVDASVIPKMKRKQRATITGLTRPRISTPKVDGYKLNENPQPGSSKMMVYWTPAEIDFSIPATYVVEAHGTVYGREAESTLDPSSVLAILLKARNLGFPMAEVYGLIPSVADSSDREASSWHCLWDDLRNFFIPLANTTNYLHKEAVRGRLAGISNWSQLVALEPFFPGPIPEGIASLLSCINAAEPTSMDMARLMAELFSMRIILREELTQPSEISIGELYDKTVKRYPLLPTLLGTYLSQYWREKATKERQKEIVDYILGQECLIEGRKEEREWIV